MLTNNAVETYMSFGSMKVIDVIGIVNAMLNGYIQEDNPKTSKTLKLRDYLYTIQDVHVNALPIEVVTSEGLYDHLDTLIEVMEDYYDVYDQQLQKVKQHLYKSRYILDCVTKAMKTHGKIQAKHSKVR